MDDVGMVMKCCAILHSILLIWDGCGIEEMMTKEYWARMDPDLDDVPEDESVDVRQEHRNMEHAQHSRFSQVGRTLLLHSLPCDEQAPVQSYNPSNVLDYERLRKDSVMSFNMQCICVSGLCVRTQSTTFIVHYGTRFAKSRNHRILLEAGCKTNYVCKIQE